MNFGMCLRKYKSVIFIGLLLTFSKFKLIGQTLPTGFQEELLLVGEGATLTNIIGVLHDKAGNMYAWERNGYVWAINFNSSGQAEPHLLLDIGEEVLILDDLGLTSMVLDPDFLTNGYFYLFYAVKRGILEETPNPAYQSGSICRVTRYQADINATPMFSQVVPNSRTVLIGESASTGIPVLSNNHGGGSLVFGQDGSLLVSTGDGSENNDTGYNGEWEAAITLGVIPESHNIGSYRVQRLDSHNGKVLRINPTNGDGILSNPFYDSSDPRSPQSRVWALGVRNPFRMSYIPSTGSHHQEDGDPGYFFIGDVGSSNREEINVLQTGGENFGWPRYEGIDVVNVLYDDNQYIPSSYKKPILEYRTYSSESNVYINQTTKYEIGSPDFPGEPIAGNATLGGIVYEGTKYPSEYHNVFFMVDWGGKWIKTMTFDSNYNPISINTFLNTSESITYINYNSFDEQLYYVADSKIYRIVSNEGNKNPVAKLEKSIEAGSTPLFIGFTAKKSYDPEGQPLTYFWDFGDGSTSTEMAPHHLFQSSGVNKYKVKLTTTDDLGASSSDSSFIYINNAPPIIQSTSIDNLDYINENTSTAITLSSVISDDNTLSANLKQSWVVALVHNGHEHKNLPVVGNNLAVTLSALNCDLGNATYFYKVYLTVEEPNGLLTTKEKIIQPDCSGAQQTITFEPSQIAWLTTNPSFEVSASASSNLNTTFYITSGSATAIGNQIVLQGIPGKVEVRATQHGDNSYKQAIPVDRIFDIDRPLILNTVTIAAIPDITVPSEPIDIVASTDRVDGQLSYLISGPASIVNNQIILSGEAGEVQLRVYDAGNYQNSGDYKHITFTVTNPCPNNLIVNEFVGIDVIVEKKALESIYSTAIIETDGRLKISANKFIILEPGFKAETGSTFFADTNGCNN